jgi:hypothetical protein
MPFPSQPDHPEVIARHRVAARPAQSRAKVIFCVQGAISPLLSNLVLDELDRELERRGHRFVRYADDCNISGEYA